jgi:hypothetical protein
MVNDWKEEHKWVVKSIWAQDRMGVDSMGHLTHFGRKNVEEISRTGGSLSVGEMGQMEVGVDTYSVILEIY